jgi:hypothetical protein
MKRLASLADAKHGWVRNHRALEGNVAVRLRQLDCDPIEGMARLALDESVPVTLRARMFTELATYVAPRGKVVDCPEPEEPISMPIRPSTSILCRARNWRH